MQDRTVAVQAGCRTGRMQGRTDADQIQDKMNAGSLVEPGPELPPEPHFLAGAGAVKKGLRLVATAQALTCV